MTGPTDGKAGQSHVEVALRIRPLLARELDAEEEVSIVALDGGEEVGGAQVRVTMPTTGGSSIACSSATLARRTRKANACRVNDFHGLNYVLDPTATQSTVWEQLHVRDFCDEAFDGKAAAILCFGQTGSGKTFTMSGRTMEDESPPEEGAIEGSASAARPLVAEDGIQYRAITYIADKLAQLRQQPNMRATVKASYLELYNEQLNDLLQQKSGLKCRWSATAKSFYVEDSLMVECIDASDLLLVLREGQANRQRAGHLLNSDSSRSHVLFTVMVETRCGEAPTRYGKLTFVDLAGSERLKDTGSQGEDTKSINRSLFALGNVIEKLSERQQQQKDQTSSSPSGANNKNNNSNNKANSASFIPYRSSVLTQLLMDSLNGDCRALLIACVTPSSRFVEESLRTIYYAERAAHITTAPSQRIDREQQDRLAMQARIQHLEDENNLFRRLLGLPVKATLTEEMIAAQLAVLTKSAPGSPLFHPPAHISVLPTGRRGSSINHGGQPLPPLIPRRASSSDAHTEATRSRDSPVKPQSAGGDQSSVWSPQACSAWTADGWRGHRSASLLISRQPCPSAHQAALPSPQPERRSSSPPHPHLKSWPPSPLPLIVRLCPRH